MAIDFYTINGNASQQAADLKTAVAVLADAYARMKRILDIMGHNNDAADFSPIMTVFGASTTGAGTASQKGQALFDMANGSVKAIEGTLQTADAFNITRRVG